MINSTVLDFLFPNRWLYFTIELRTYAQIKIPSDLQFIRVSNPALNELMRF